MRRLMYIIAANERESAGRRHYRREDHVYLPPAASEEAELSRQTELSRHT